MMLSLLIYAATAAAGDLPPEGGIACNFQDPGGPSSSQAPLRVYWETPDSASGTINSIVCVEPSFSIPPNAPQRAFLVQYQSSLSQPILNDRGFRTLAGPFTESMPLKTVTLARIAATGQALTQMYVTPSNNPQHRRYYSPLHNKKLEIVIEIENGVELKLSQRNNSVSGVSPQSATLRSGDFVDGFLALSTKVQYAFGSVLVDVCGAKTCVSYSIDDSFGTLAPEFYLGEQIQNSPLVADPSTFRARYWLTNVGMPE